MTIHEDHDGRIDLEQLERELIHYTDRPLRIGSFSAASNVTGILSDTRAISVLLHRHGARSFWDFAAAAPYVDIELEPHRPGPDAELEFKLGQIRFQLQDWAAAVKALDSAVSHKGLKQPGVANLLLGIAAYHLGHRRQALDALTQAMYHKQTRDQAEWWSKKIHREDSGSPSSDG